MKAISYQAFGGLDVLEVTDVESHAPGHDEVQVRVIATSLNPIDAKIRRGEMKLMSGTHFPKRMGQDFSGVVAAVGRDVKDFAVGDAVYGCCRGMKDGALAESVNTPAAYVAKKPTTIDHATAASVPVVAQAALQSLVGVGHVKAGTRVLVNGCTGGVGLYALQLAKAMGAEVTGVCGPDGVALAKELGASAVIDYRTRDVLEAGLQFDVLLELSGRLPFDRTHVVLADHGLYLDFSPSATAIVGNAIANPFRNHKHKFVMTESRTADLQSLGASIDGGALRPAPVRVFAFEQFREACAAAEKGAVLGKLVVRVAPEP